MDEYNKDTNMENHLDSTGNLIDPSLGTDLNFEHYFGIPNNMNKQRIRWYLNDKRDRKFITKTDYNKCMKFFDLFSYIEDINFSFCYPKIVNGQFSLEWYYKPNENQSFSVQFRYTESLLDSRRVMMYIHLPEIDPRLMPEHKVTTSSLNTVEVIVGKYDNTVNKLSVIMSGDQDRYMKNAIESFNLNKLNNSKPYNRNLTNLVKDLCYKLTK